MVSMLDTSRGLCRHCSWHRGIARPHFSTVSRSCFSSLHPSPLSSPTLCAQTPPPPSATTAASSSPSPSCLTAARAPVRLAMSSSCSPLPFPPLLVCFCAQSSWWPCSSERTAMPNGLSSMPPPVHGGPSHRSQSTARGLHPRVFLFKNKPKNQLSREFCKIAPRNFKTPYLFNHNSKCGDSCAKILRITCSYILYSQLAHVCCILLIDYVCFALGNAMLEPFFEDFQGQAFEESSFFCRVARQVPLTILCLLLSCLFCRSRTA
jgi:hypothetical protein